MSKSLIDNKRRPGKVFRVLGRVDLLECFRDNGSLAVDGTDAIIPTVNDLSRRHDYYDAVVDFQDAHGEDHLSFAENHAGKNIYDKTILYGVEQILWPKHGVDRPGPTGRYFHPDLDLEAACGVFQKGTDPRVDSYSGLYNNGRHAPANVRAQHPFLGEPTGFVEWVKGWAEYFDCDEIQLDVVGVALCFCVSFTAIDARGETFKGKPWRVRVIEDAVRAVTFKPGDYDAEIAKLKGLGIEIIQSADACSSS